MKSGAGGNWRRFDEKFDASIVKQTELSCLSAVGEMLLKNRNIFIENLLLANNSEIREAIFYLITKSFNNLYKDEFNYMSEKYSYFLLIKQNGEDTLYTQSGKINY